MRFCPKCGSKLKDDDKFCTTCGAKLTDSSESDDGQEFTEETEEPQQTRIRYTSGPLGYIRPEVFWPIAGLIYFLICLYNRSIIIWGLSIGLLRPPESKKEWAYAMVTIVIVAALVYW